MVGSGSRERLASMQCMAVDVSYDARPYHKSICPVLTSPYRLSCILLQKACHTSAGGVGGGLATPDYCQPPSLHQSTLISEWFAAANKNVYTIVACAR